MEVVTYGITTLKTWDTEQCIYLIRVKFKGALSAKNDSINTLRTGDADLRFYITTVQDG